MGATATENDRSVGPLGLTWDSTGSALTPSGQLRTTRNCRSDNYRLKSQHPAIPREVFEMYYDC